MNSLRNRSGLLRAPTVCVTLLLLNAVAGALVYWDTSLFSVAGGFFCLLSVGALLYALVELRSCMIFQFRLVFLASIGYFAALAKLIDPDLWFSPVAVEAQTFEVGVRMYGLTCIAVLAAYLGLVANKVPVSLPSPLNVANRQFPWSVLFWVCAPLLIWVGYLSAISYGPLVWEGTYASGEGEGQLLGNLQSLGVILLATAWLAANRLTKLHVSAVWLLAFYLLGWSILMRGGRLEFLSGVLAMFVGLRVAHGKSARVPLKAYLLLAVAALLLEVWGYLRSTMMLDGSEPMFEMYQRLFDDNILFAATVSGVATTFANTVHMLDTSVVDFIYGRSYAEYLLRTAPEFLYPNRPQDMSAIFTQHGYASVGGFFELAEAYINFGIVGVLVVPFAISWVFSYVYRRSMGGNLLSYYLLLGLLSVFFRGAWYQTFAYYKGLVTAVVIFMLVMFLVLLFGSIRTSRVAKA